MGIDSKVKVISGEYVGYYGIVTAWGTEYATVTHKPDFAGFQIAIDDLVNDE